MLGNLLKYEFRANIRTLLPLYLVILISSLFLGISINLFPHMGFGANFIYPILFLAYLGTLIVTSVTTLVIIIQRFSKNLLGDEGYLMFTLPVTTHHLISSKLIVATVYSILAGLVAFLSFLIIAFSSSTIEIVYFIDMAQMFFQTYGFDSFTLLIIGIIFSISSTFMGILVVYTSISLGHLANKHRSALAVVSFLVIQSIINFISNITGLILGDSSYNLFARAFNNEVAIAAVTLMILTAITIILSFIFYIITYLILDKKLNLE